MLHKRSSKHAVNNSVTRISAQHRLEISEGKDLVGARDRRLLPAYDLYCEAMGRPGGYASDAAIFIDKLTKSTTILYQVEQKLAGICLWQVIHKHRAIIMALAVERSRRESGIGSSLMNAALSGMQEASVDDVAADVLVTSQAMSFYEKHGFMRLSYDAPGPSQDVPMRRTLHGSASRQN